MIRVPQKKMHCMLCFPCSLGNMMLIALIDLLQLYWSFHSSLNSCIWGKFSNIASPPPAPPNMYILTWLKVQILEGVWIWCRGARMLVLIFDTRKWIFLYPWGLRGFHKSLDTQSYLQQVPSIFRGIGKILMNLEPLLYLKALTRGIWTFSNPSQVLERPESNGKNLKEPYESLKLAVRDIRTLSENFQALHIPSRDQWKLAEPCWALLILIGKSTLVWDIYKPCQSLKGSVGDLSSLSKTFWAWLAEFKLFTSLVNTERAQ